MYACALTAEVMNAISPGSLHNISWISLSSLWLLLFSLIFFCLSLIADFYLALLYVMWHSGVEMVKYNNLEEGEERFKIENS